MSLPHCDAESSALPGAWDAFVSGLPQRPARVGVVDVVPARRQVFVAWARARLGLEARVLGAGLPAPLELAVERPEQVGRDRVANGVWARTFRPGQAVVVVDAGTAVTFDVVDAEGRFRGGAIAPGWRALRGGLVGAAPALPAVDPPAQPPPALGQDTREAIAAGLFHGLAGLVARLAGELASELGQPLRSVATGGDARLLEQAGVVDEVVPDVTLLGLRAALDAAVSE